MKYVECPFADFCSVDSFSIIDVVHLFVILLLLLIIIFLFYYIFLKGGAKHGK